MIKEKPKLKKYYDIKMECLVPAMITYRVFAEDEKEALSLIDKAIPTNVKPDHRRKRAIKATVYDSGCTTIKLTKHYSK